MTKTLYLHIGHYKTGTTALQWFLTENAAYLAKNGLQYDQSLLNFNKHSRLAFSILKAVGVDSLMHGYDLPVTPREVWTTLFDAVRKGKRQKTIVSSEEFMRIGEYPEAGAMLAKMVAMGQDIDIRIIVYLRSPQAHLQSWYNQLIKMGIPTPDYNTAVCTRMERIHYDYEQALKPWVEIFGADKVDVRAYVRGGDDGTALIADFISAVGGDWKGPRGLQLPDVDPNPRLDPHSAQLMHMMQGADMPSSIVDWTLSRARDYFQSDAGRAPLSDPQIFAPIIDASRAGIAAIEPLMGGDLAESLAAELPVAAPPPGPEDIAWRLSGFLLSELHLVRQKAQRTNAQLTRRIDAIEAKLGKGK